MAHAVLKSSTGVKEAAGKVEVLIESAADLDELPAEYAPGSMAYTADMTLMYQKAINGTWARIGG